MAYIHLEKLAASPENTPDGFKSSVSCKYGNILISAECDCAPGGEGRLSVRVFGNVRRTKPLPEEDVEYLLSRFGLDKSAPGVPDARGVGFTFSQDVEKGWLRVYGGIFGWVDPRDTWTGM
ncbi:MAG: hypothetical protein LBN99_04525 [Oscillospiraceae bacterium]|jgi:hypothetical protein|nr:hypothetical protein [Oscillospiraceae bacterium]